MIRRVDKYELMGPPGIDAVFNRADPIRADAVGAEIRVNQLLIHFGHPAELEIAPFAVAVELTDHRPVLSVRGECIGFVAAPHREEYFASEEAGLGERQPSYAR